MGGAAGSGGCRARGASPAASVAGQPPPAAPAGLPASDIADPALAEAGRARIEWARRGMPVLGLLGRRFAGDRPFAGLTVAACLNVTPEAAVLIETLRAGDALVAVAASNPLSTQDDVAAALAASGRVSVHARAGVDAAGYAAHLHQALDAGPDLVVDDGGDLVDTLHAGRPELLRQVRGGCEATVSGVVRLRRMAEAGALAFPMVAADATTTKRMFDNTSGAGQSVIDAVLRATNTLLAGRVVVVAGYGACGAGIADRARGLRAQVIVTEVDPVRALAAALNGFRVLSMADAAPLAEIVITATGSRDVVGREHVHRLRDGVILANAGHFDVEIDVRALADAAAEVTWGVRPHADEYLLGDGRRVVLLAEGRVVNLVAAEGNPPEVMDVAFAGQALALAWLAGRGGAMPAGVHDVPAEIDAEVARLTLESLGARVDVLTPAQREYLSSWQRRP